MQLNDEISKGCQSKHILVSKMRTLVDVGKDKPIVFAHDIQTMPGLAGVSGFENCGERALIMARHNKDIVLLNHKPDADYLRYLESIDLGPKVVLSLNSHNLSEGINKNVFAFDEGFVSPFYSSETDKKIADSLSQKFIGANENIIMKYYDKSSFKEICKELSLDTADGELFRRTKSRAKDFDILNDMIDKYLPVTGNVVVRETTMSGGWLVEFINSENKIKAINKLLDSEGRKFLVEVKLELANSPCVVGIVNNDSYSVFALSSQLLENAKSYIGSIFDYNEPIHPKIENAINKICKKMVEDGYQGAFGVDFLETKDGKILLCECNARINGSTYPHELRQRVIENGHNFPVVFSFNAKIPPCENFDKFQANPIIKNLLYKGDNNPGIVPFETSKLPTGNISCIAIAYTKEEALKMSDMIKKAYEK